MRRHRKWLVHFIAECEECDWHTEGYESGQRQAAEHARKTGHRISGEEGYAIRYNESQDMKKEA
jgi:hypothetical protein